MKVEVVGSRLAVTAIPRASHIKQVLVVGSWNGDECLFIIANGK